MDTASDTSGPSAPLATAGDAKAEARVQRALPGRLAITLFLVLVAAVVGGSYLLGNVYGGLTSRFEAQSPITRWTAEVRSDPRSLVAHVQLGYAYQNESRFREALTQYRYVIRKDPSNTAALYNSGTVYRELGEVERFEASMLEVLRVQPDHVMAAKALGEYYSTEQRYESVLRVVVPVADAHPGVADLRYLVGQGCENTGDPERALDNYRASAELADTPGVRAAIARLESVPR